MREVYSMGKDKRNNTDKNEYFELGIGDDILSG